MKFKYLLLLLLISTSSSRRKAPPKNWDSGPCQKLMSNYGEAAQCRQCKDDHHGYGENYQQMVNKALLQPPPLPGTASPNQSKPKAWLRIAIGTIPRKTEQPYLERVLLSIADELPHTLNSNDVPPIGRIEVVVVNFRPGQHPVFDRIKKKLSSPHPASVHFTFVEIKPVRCDPPVPQNWEYKKGLSPEVSPRQQTRDVVSLYKTVKRFGSTNSDQVTCQHALIVEDDFELCGGGLHLIKHAITKASRAGWSGLRVGVAGNGIIVPCNDIEPIASYLLDHQYMMPVDLLLPEWFIRIHKRAKGYLHESSIFRINNKNLFNHIGTVSSFTDGRGQRKTSMCGETLTSKTWMKEESFDTKCSKYGLSPCNDPALKINSVQLKYHSGSNSRSVPGHIQVIKGNVGESCDAVCFRGLHRHGDIIDQNVRAKGLKCGLNDFVFINNCRYLRRDFQKCRGGCFALQTMVSQNSIGGIPKQLFGGMSPGLIVSSNSKTDGLLALGRNGKVDRDEEKGLCWHRQSSRQHVMINSVNMPSSCSAKHPKVKRLCPCIDVSLIEKK